ncbi:MAG: FAD-dependent monooxygenase [Hyphomicrobiales bacterium]
MSKGNDISTEIFVSGGGLTGLATALALGGPASPCRFKVTLADAGDPAAQRHTVFDGRASAITASARQMFKTLGVWDALQPHAQPMNEIVVTDSQLGAQERPTLLHFGEQQQPGQPASYMIENQHLYAALYDAAVQSDHVTILAHESVVAFDFDGPRAHAELQSGTNISAEVVAAADGRNSFARQSAGIKTLGWSYKQSGIVTTVAHERPHNGVAEENFLPAGPFAILPLPNNHASLVWTEEAHLAKQIMALDDKGFRAELEHRFGEHLGAIEPIGPRFSYPLALHLADRFSSNRLALLGDAAHVVHPIAGLGFNLALRDIAALADVLTEQARLGLDIGAVDALERYESWRRFDTVKVALMCDGLNRLFSNDIEPIRRLRDMGLEFVDRLDPAKRFFMREAAGLNGNLPSLMRGSGA